MDMDGTLLNKQDEITPATKQALLACEEKGIRLMLASGRSYVRMMHFAEELMIKEHGGAMIEVNGLVLNRLTKGERTVFGQLYREDMEKLVPVLRAHEVEIQSYQDDSMFYWIPECRRELKIAERKAKGYPETHPLLADLWGWVSPNKHNYPNLIEVSSMDELPQSLNKMNCMDVPEKMEEVYEDLKSRFAGRYEIVRTAPRAVEILPGGISKGKVLKAFMEEEGILPEEIIVFGDGENDVAMLQQAKYGIAMGNAKDYVKKYAYDVTDDHNSDGIAKTLKKYGII